MQARVRHGTRVETPELSGDPARCGRLFEGQADNIGAVKVADFSEDLLGLGIMPFWLVHKGG